MLSGHNIICFGSERWEYPGLQQTIMRYLSKENRVLFFNSLGTRRIAFDRTFFRACTRRLTAFFSDNNHAPADSVRVLNPHFIPLTYSTLATRINRSLISRQCRSLVSEMQLSSYILWIGTPVVSPLLNRLSPDLVVYNPVDRYHAFSFVDSVKMKAYERQAAQQADVILCTSTAIRNDLLRFNRNTFNVSHGVDFAHFSAAAQSSCVPDDIRGIRPPIIGYFGGLSERVNYTLIRETARSYPDASVVLIGSQLVSLDEIKTIPNVHCLGRKPFSMLPLYLKHFSVCLIPYQVNELMDAVDPIKLREYFCLGKPVVSSPLPEVAAYDDLVFIGKDTDDFVTKVGLALAEKDDVLTARRIQIAQQSDWPAKMASISNIIQEALQRKRGKKRIIGSTYGFKEANRDQ